MSGYLDAEWAKKVLLNHRREDPLNVEMAIESVIAYIENNDKKAKFDNTTYENDEILTDALKEC